MAGFLVFRLYAPLASWGEIAVGESRHSASYPSRSALLGLLAAALGIRRDDDAGQQALAAACRLGVKLHAEGMPLRDYHTVQTGPQLKKLRYRTRRQELSLPARDQLGTLLSAREYRCDSFSTVAVMVDSAAAYSLETLAEALRHPVFPLYLGRKSCPPAAPLAARVIACASLKEALDAFDDRPFPELGRKSSGLPKRRHGARYYWDAALGENGLHPGMVADLRLTRHDEPASRPRWQFSPREEYLKMESGNV